MSAHETQLSEHEDFPGTLAELLEEYRRLQQEVEEATRRLDAIDERVSQLISRSNDDGK